MGELQSALDALSAEDLFGLSGPQLLDRTAVLVAARNRIDAELSRTVRRAELAQAAEHDGLTTMQSWLRGHARLSPAAAAAVVRAGRALERLPALSAAHAAGAVTAEQVAAVAPVTRPEHVAAADAAGVDVAGVDAALAEVAAGRPYAELRQVVAHYLARLDPDGPEPDPTEGRSLVWWRHADGTVSGRFDLDAVGGEKVLTALEPLVQAGRSAADERSRARQHGDALVQLADLALASGGLPVLRTVKPHLLVRIDLDDLVDPATGPAAAQTGWGAAISAARARWLACDSSVTRIVIGPDGQPLDLGRAHRVVPPHLRRAVEARDGGCVFAGCDAPAAWCDVHHLVHWAYGGETSLNNSALLCERHHTKAHHGFTVVRGPDGRWHTYRPDGTEIIISPPDHRDGPPVRERDPRDHTLAGTTSGAVP